MLKKVCVYCASSDRVDRSYHQAAYTLGQQLAQNGIQIVYGGGGRGSMGALADGALSAGGEVFGVLPRFMADLEWGHPGLTTLDLVEDMRERKHRMLIDTDAAIALPGGCGTFEELFEVLTLKRLTLYLKPIVLMNTQRYFDPCIKMLEHAVENHFMDAEHAKMWSVVNEPVEVIPAINSAARWTEQARDFAVPSVND